MKYWKHLSQVHQYLEARKEKGVIALQTLISHAKKGSAELVVLSFTYEHIEAYVKRNGQFERNEDMFSTLSQSEMDELTSASYEEENGFEDYEYWKFYELVGELTEMWLVSCFEAASAEAIPDIPFYFKQNHDAMHILRLNDCERLLEKSEFEMYVKNNQRNLIELLG